MQKVILITGLPRSGTTVLGHLLGQIDGFFFAGELNRTAEEMVADGKQCGCGAPLQQCELWRPLFESSGGAARTSLERLPFGRHDPRARAVVGHLLAKARKGRSEASSRYARVERLFDDIALTSGARVIVDSSKGPGYAAFLRRLPSIELTLVHLVRDPAAVAASERRKAARTGKRSIPLMQVGLMWTLWNPLIEALGPRGRYVRVAYGGFASSPRATLESIARAAGEDVELDFLEGNTAQLRPTHSVEGNRSRFAAGEVEIAPDESWRTDGLLSRRERVLLRVLTLPARLRYSG